MPEAGRVRAGRRRTRVGRWRGSARGRTGGPAANSGAEAGHGVAAVVLERHRRHRHEHVVGQQVHQRGDVGRLPRADEPAATDRRPAAAASARRARRPRRRPASRLGGRALEACARPLQRAVDRVHRAAQHARDLGGGEPQDVAQHEDGELAGRQDLAGGHEGQRDGLGQLVAGLRAGWRGGQAVEEGVGVGLQPDDLAEPGRLGRLHVGHVPRLGRAPAAARRASRHRRVATW